MKFWGARKYRTMVHAEHTGFSTPLKREEICFRRLDEAF